MATETVTLKGIVKWAHNLRSPDERFGKYQANFSLDSESQAVYDEAGIQVSAKEDKDDGKLYYKLSRRPVDIIKGKTVNWGPVPVFDADGNEWPEGKTIGNGSEVTIKVDVYDSRKGKGHRLVGVKVDKLVEYTAPTAEGTPEKPVEKKKGGKGVPF